MCVFEGQGRTGMIADIQNVKRGLGILPYGNFIIRTVGKYGEFRPCVRTWAVLAILPTTLPEGVSLIIKFWEKLSFYLILDV